MELWRPLPLVFNTHAERALEIPGRFDDRLGDLPPDNSLLRRVPHLELTSGCDRGGDNFKISEGHKVPDFQFALAHNGQGRRLHPADTDHPPRALSQDDGRGAGE